MIPDAMTGDYVGWVIGVLGLGAAGVQTVMARKSDARLRRLEEFLTQRAVSQPEGAPRASDLIAEVGTPGRGVRRTLGDVIGTLPEREKLVVTLYYYEGLTLAEIGEIMGVSPSTVSRLHTKAILRLKSRLAEDSPD